MPYTPPDELFRERAERATRRVLIAICLGVLASAALGGLISVLERCGS
jgi:hypothetical protein